MQEQCFLNFLLYRSFKLLSAKKSDKKLADRKLIDLNQSVSSKKINPIWNLFNNDLFQKSKQLQLL